MILVPPYGQILRINEFISLQLSSYTECTCHYWLNFCENKTAMNNPSYMSQVLEIQEFEGSHSYGFYWGLDSVKYLPELSFQQLLSRFDVTNMIYTFPTTTTFAQMSLTEQTNDWTNAHDVYFDTKITGSSVTANDNLMPSDLDQYCLRYMNQMIFRINPTGGGIKTVITISKLKSFTDILSATGGLFSPTLTFFTVLFGFLLTSNKFGFAKKQGWSDKEKLKAALYLQELGLLTDKQYQEALQHKQLNK